MMRINTLRRTDDYNEVLAKEPRSKLPVYDKSLSVGKQMEANITLTNPNHDSQER